MLTEISFSKKDLNYNKIIPTMNIKFYDDNQPEKQKIKCVSKIRWVWEQYRRIQRNKCKALMFLMTK